MTNWHAISEKEALEKLESSEKGLNEKEAEKRLKRYGRNELKEIMKIKPFFIFLEQFKSIFVIILLFAAVFSLFIGHLVDFTVILAIVIINSAIGFGQQYKAEKTIAELKGTLVPKVRVLRGGRLEEISSIELVPGDIILVSDGDKVMADCRIIHSSDLQTNETVLTGESFPQSKNAERVKLETPIADRENMLYMGTIIARGNGKAVVAATGMSTEFGKIAGLVQEIKKRKTLLEENLDQFSKKIAFIIVILTLVTIALGFFRGEDKFHMFLTGISLAVSVIPEGLPAVIVLTLAFAIMRMKKHNSLIRKLPAAETLGRTTVICTDKTGTLTEEEMSVTKLYCNNKDFLIHKNDFYIGKRKIHAKEFHELMLLLKTGVMCNNARIEKENSKIEIFGDPTERALVISADKAGLLKKEETEKEVRIIEYSFSPKRKMMSIVRNSKGKLESYVKGAPDIVLERCTKEMINGQARLLNSKRKAELLGIYEEMAGKALRVLAFAYKEIPKYAKLSQKIAEESLIFIGFQGMIDPPRPEVKNSIKECQLAGIKVKMITGDSLLTATAIGDMIGLYGESIEEKNLEKLSKKEFESAVKEKTIFARIIPEMKLRIIDALKEQKEIVAVTGDGVNDILALKAAHIGVAMGIRGSDVAREVSDIILLDDNFSSIVETVAEGRRVYDNLKKSIQAHIAANAGELFVVLFALAFAFPLPMLPLAILWMNLITDSLPSLSLSVEPAEKDIMRRKPINHNDGILRPIWKFVLVAGIVTVIIAMLLFINFYEEDIVKARTIVITSAVICEMCVVLASRSEKNLWNIKFMGNKFLLGSIGFALVLQLIAIYTPLSQVFGFEALTLGELALVFGVSLITLIALEAWKYLRNILIKKSLCLTTHQAGCPIISKI